MKSTTIHSLIIIILISLINFRIIIIFNKSLINNTHICTKHTKRKKTITSLLQEVEEVAEASNEEDQIEEEVALEEVEALISNKTKIFMHLNLSSIISNMMIIILKTMEMNMETKNITKKYRNRSNKKDSINQRIFTKNISQKIIREL